MTIKITQTLWCDFYFHDCETFPHAANIRFQFSRLNYIAFLPPFVLTKWRS